eukprot:1157932-Pelagomonas_calceolata.AAC.2
MLHIHAPCQTLLAAQRGPPSEPCKCPGLQPAAHCGRPSLPLEPAEQAQIKYRCTSFSQALLAAHRGSPPSQLNPEGQVRIKCWSL